jgi:hypothetical protein
MRLGAGSHVCHHARRRQVVPRAWRPQTRARTCACRSATAPRSNGCRRKPSSTTAPASSSSTRSSWARTPSISAARSCASAGARWASALCADQPSSAPASASPAAWSGTSRAARRRRPGQPAGPGRAQRVRDPAGGRQAAAGGAGGASCAPASRAGLSQVKSVFVARHLGDDSEAARAAMLRVWQAVRPHLLGDRRVRAAHLEYLRNRHGPDATRKRQAADLHRRPAGRAPARARPEAELSGSGGPDHRRDHGRRARRPQRGGADGEGATILAAPT